MQEVIKHMSGQIEYELTPQGLRVVNTVLHNLSTFLPEPNLIMICTYIEGFTREGVPGVTDPNESRSYYQTFDVLKDGILEALPDLPKDSLRDLKLDHTVAHLLLIVLNAMPCCKVTDVKGVKKLGSGAELCL